MNCFHLRRPLISLIVIKEHYWSDFDGYWTQDSFIWIPAVWRNERPAQVETIHKGIKLFKTHAQSKPDFADVFMWIQKS